MQWLKAAWEANSPTRPTSWPLIHLRLNLRPEQVGQTLQHVLMLLLPVAGHACALEAERQPLAGSYEPL